MYKQIVIKVGDLILQGELNDSKTANSIWTSLPIESLAQTWGDEIYFSVPIAEELEDTAQEIVEVGDLGYWPQGPALCIFYGPTPISRQGEIRPASAVNIVGRVKDNPGILKRASEGDRVRLEERKNQ